MRLRIWWRRPSQRLKSPTTETRQRVRRPNREKHAGDALMFDEMRAQTPVKLAVRALDEEIIVYRPQDWAEGVRVGQVPCAAGIRSPKAVGETVGLSREKAFEEIPVAPLKFERIPVLP